MLRSNTIVVRRPANNDNACDVVATNGSPFDPGGVWNSGPTVRKGRLVRTKPNPEDSEFVGFGIALENPRVMAGTDDSRNKNKNHNNNTSRASADESMRRHWVLGTYGQLVPGSPAIWDFVSGFGWLVYDGRPWVPVREDGRTTRTPALADPGRAPRTAVGLDRDSNLMLLVVDGCEHCLRRKGLTLDELADLLVRLGAVYAVNMDGGGSSTMAMPSSPILLRDNAQSNGKTTPDNGFASGSTEEHDDYDVINRPTCLDLPFPHCQRPVATVLCVSSSNRNKPEP
eukprot:jgi/Psemu1/238814/estExt_Genewise1.C_1160004